MQRGGEEKDPSSRELSNGSHHSIAGVVDQDVDRTMSLIDILDLLDNAILSLCHVYLDDMTTRTLNGVYGITGSDSVAHRSNNFVTGLEGM